MISTHAPSPPWYGGVITSVPFVAAAWLLAYTLLAVPPLEALGAWNYVGVFGLLVVQGVLLTFWRGERYVRPTRTSPVHRTTAASRD